MRTYRKHDFPVGDVRRFLEPGPIVLVSSAFRGQTNVMTMGWHMVLEFVPSLLGCMIAGSNHSFELIRRSKECVINLPTTDLARQVVGIGNCSGSSTDKFARFKLTPERATKVKAPLIAECYASFECKLADGRMIERYNLFVFEVVAAHVARTPRFPRTLHYRGDGIFMLSGENTARWRGRFDQRSL